jgi:ABC-type uncharacterized transport system involved in gliding motility auxiliary subunit
LDHSTNGNGNDPAPKDVESPEQVARLVVYGDSDFASNARLSLLGNKDLFLNTVQWLVRHEQFITQRPKDTRQSKISALVLTAEQTRHLFLLAIVAEPGFILIMGGLVSVYRRRHRRE